MSAVLFMRNGSAHSSPDLQYLQENFSNFFHALYEPILKSLESVYYTSKQELRGHIFTKQPRSKISQFADDTTIITNNTDSLKSHLQIIEWFGTVSGLKLNKKKTKAMWLGKMKHSNSNKLALKSTKNPIKVLGTFLSYNQNKNIEENFLNLTEFEE